MAPKKVLQGERFILKPEDPLFPDAFKSLTQVPVAIYGVGNPEALREGLAIVGARKASPYGLSCSRRFAARAAEKGVTVISGGALGCDGEAHRGALDAKGTTVCFLGGGCDSLYPASHFSLFQEIVDGGGAVVSEHLWDVRPAPYMFRLRNRLIAALSRATLIAEAGMPSGTFSTADEALASNREVLAIPGPITSFLSQGTNYLIKQGATPIIDEVTFDDALFWLFGILKEPVCAPSDGARTPGKITSQEGTLEAVVERVLCTGPMRLDDLLRNKEIMEHSGDDTLAVSHLLVALCALETSGAVQLYGDGRYAVK